MKSRGSLGALALVWVMLMSGCTRTKPLDEPKNPVPRYRALAVLVKAVERRRLAPPFERDARALVLLLGSIVADRPQVQVQAGATLRELSSAGQFHDLWIHTGIERKTHNIIVCVSTGDLKSGPGAWGFVVKPSGSVACGRLSDAEADATQPDPASDTERAKRSNGGFRFVDEDDDEDDDEDGD